MFNNIKLWSIACKSLPFHDLSSTMPSNLTCGSAAERRQVFISFASSEEKPPPLTPIRQRLIPNHRWQDTQNRQSAKFLANGALIGGAICRYWGSLWAEVFTTTLCLVLSRRQSRSMFCCLGKCIRSSNTDVKYLYSLRKTRVSGRCKLISWYPIPNQFMSSYSVLSSKIFNSIVPILAE